MRRRRLRQGWTPTPPHSGSPRKAIHAQRAKKRDPNRSADLDPESDAMIRAPAAAAKSTSPVACVTARRTRPPPKWKWISMFANFLYAVALTLAAPIILFRMIRHGRYRRGGGEKLLGLSPRRAAALKGGGLKATADRCIWLHAVSVGEVNLLQGILKQLQQ